MTVTAELRTSVKNVKIKYPCIMISNTGNVILFIEESCGTIIINRSSYHEVGHYSTGWDMEGFKPLPSGDSVTLIQD